MAMENQKDLVLNPNEYNYILDKTKGIVQCCVGPYKNSLSNTDSPVRFDTRSKRFVECSVDESISLFVTAPENWYCVLKNPAPDGAHPSPRISNELPNLLIGKKVNITGPISFALYPGQMAKVIKGHHLHSNQYLLVRVYDEDAAQANWHSSVIKINTPAPSDSENNEDKDKKDETEEKPQAESSIASINAQDLSVGKLMIIKGTEVSFYIPPTGIEVIPTAHNEYIREAVTLERLEYCILKDENGNKRYVHGPAVVFPEPTETFVPSGNPANGFKFKAIELSKISGIYVKVVAAYDEDGKHHDVGEELFITGTQQMIYYPRPEHAIIAYDDRILHYAIAIPAGEGRYVLDRMKGIISMVKGPTMFLPDPRYQVIVKRKLSRSQAELWYPDNDEVYDYNEQLDEDDTDLYASNSSSSTLMSRGLMKSYNDVEPGGFLNRNTSYTEPRSITFDDKFAGVVDIDVWTGYAINVISKDGSRKVITGPQTYLMEYDETLEILEMSTGKPKTTDHLIRTVYLRVDNNKIGDIINVETKDFVKTSVKVSYTVNFLPEFKDKWFSVENYVKFLCDRMRSIVKREAKKYTIEQFYQNYSDIVRNLILNLNRGSDDESDGYRGRLFPENGMLIEEVDVLTVDVPKGIADLLNAHQYDMIKKAIELSDAEQRKDVAKRLSDVEKAIKDIEHASMVYGMKLQTEKYNLQSEYEKLQINSDAAEELLKLTNEQHEQSLLDEIAEKKLARKKKENDANVAYRTDLADLEKARRDAYAESMAKMLAAISPQLAASIESLKEHALFADIAQKMSPLAIVNGDSIADTANKLLEGSALENIFKKLTKLPIEIQSGGEDTLNQSQM